MASDLALVAATQANALFKIRVASFIPGDAEREHECEDREQAAAMTTNTAMEENAFTPHKRLHEKMQHCTHSLVPEPTIEVAPVIDVQPPPPAIRGVRVVDVGAIDDVLGVASRPFDGIVTRAHVERSLVGFAEDTPWHRRNARTRVERRIARS